MRILVVEDEDSIAGVVKRGLEEAYYDVDIAANGLTGLRMAREGAYSLILLDIMLPEMDGWTVCQNLRASRNTTPILMLTARDEIEDRVHGLEIGADDYLPKPFSFAELLARVQALLRRDKVYRTRVIRIGNLEIDTGTRRVNRGGQEIVLTPREYTLLEALAANEGRTLSREVILQRIWMDDDSYSNTVDVHIGSLRRKIDTGDEEKLIHTIHRVGYCLKREDAEP